MNRPVRVARAGWGRWFLILLLVGVGVWFARLDRSTPTTEAGETSLGPQPPFTGITRAVFVGAGDSLVVTREGARWWVTHPLRDLASEERMTELLRELNGLKAQRVLPDREGRPFGLAPAHHRIRLTDESGREFRIALGDSAPAASALYGKVDGEDRVVLLDSFTMRRHFRPQLTYYRDTFATQFGPGPLDSLEVRIPEVGFRGIRRSAERWTARYPAGLELDPLPINRAIQHLRLPNIRGYVDQPGDLHALGLNPPRAVWILFQAGRAETVRVGSPTPDQESVHIVPSGRNVVALIGSDFFRDFVDGWPRLAERRLLSIPRDSIRVIRFLDGVGGYLRERGRWSEALSGAAVADTAAFGRDFRNLLGLRYRSYPRRSTPPRVSEVTRVLVRSATQVETLWIAVDSDTTAWARSSRRPDWGNVSPLVVKAWRYRATRVKA